MSESSPSTCAKLDLPSAETIRKYSGNGTLELSVPTALDEAKIKQIKREMAEAIVEWLLFRITGQNKSDVAARAWVLQHAIERQTKFPEDRRHASQVDLAKDLGAGKTAISNRIKACEALLRDLGVDFSV